MNAFEEGARRLIPAVLVYLRSADDKVLMLHRLGGEGGGKPGDDHAGKWNGLGGKLEADESPWECACRELKEESGLTLPEAAFEFLGILQFPNFKPHKSEDWLCIVFEARMDMLAADVQLGTCSEGALAWIPIDQLATLNLWPGDRLFIPLVVARKKFIGTIWYEGQSVKRYDVREI